MKYSFAVCSSLLLFLLFMVSGCTDDAASGSSDGVQLISLHLTSSGVPSASPLPGSGGNPETDVKNAYAVFCTPSLPGGDDIVYRVVKGTNIRNTSQPNVKTFDVSLEVTIGTPSQLNCYVLANIEEKNSGLTSVLTDIVGQPYAVAQEKLLSNHPVAPSSLKTDDSFVMWGMTDRPIFTDGTRQNRTVDLIRALARIDIGVGQKTGEQEWSGKDASGQPVPFVMTDVYIYRSADRYAFMPLRDAYDQLLQKVTQVSAVGERLPAENCFHYEVPAENDGRCICKTIYIPEQNIKVTDGGTPGDNNHTNRCAMVVGGKYNNHQKTYYRIDFCEGSALSDVLRNHLYEISIVKVEGDGDPTPGEAYANTTSSMTATVVPWSRESRDIAFDGADYIHVGSRLVRLPGNKDMTAALEVESSVGVDNWSMELKKKEDGTVVTAGKGARTIENGDFVVKLPQKKGEPILFTTKNILKDDETRESLLTIRIKRIEMTIRILQYPDTPVDWMEGGEIEKDL